MDSESSNTQPEIQVGRRIEAKSMKAVEVTGTIDLDGNLSLDEPIQVTTHSRVRVIVLFSELLEEAEDLDDTPIEVVKASLRRALQQAQAGQRIPLSQMWEGVDSD